LPSVFPKQCSTLTPSNPRHDPDGRALYSISIVAIGGEGADILIVKVAGLPKGITAGSPVKVGDLVATTWQMKDRNGVSFRAESIDSLGASVTPSKSSPAA
jgi:hypothetical protein